MPPDLALLSTLIGSNYPCLELIFMVPKVFEPLKFDCNCLSECPSEIMERVLTIIKSVCKLIPADSREKLISDLKNRLLKFDSPPELIAVSVGTLAKVKLVFMCE